MTSCMLGAKHFAVHSGPEWNRHEFNAENIKPRDLYETYLPPFEALVKEGKVKEVMCAYNRFEGDPCCGSDRLLMQILRDEWGFDGIVLSDCGAIADFYRDYGHKTHPDAESASAAAVLSGTDLECGSSYEALVEAVKQGKIDEKAVDVAVKSSFDGSLCLGMKWTSRRRCPGLAFLFLWWLLPDTILWRSTWRASQ